MIRTWERPLLAHCHFLALCSRKAGSSTRPLNKGAIPWEVHPYYLTRLCLHPCEVWGTWKYSVSNPSKVRKSSKRQKDRKARTALTRKQTKEPIVPELAWLLTGGACRLTEEREIKWRDDGDVTGKVLCHMASGVWATYKEVENNSLLFREWFKRSGISK